MTSAGVPFYKLSGAGNDFVALCEPRQPPSEEFVRTVCRRGHSLGADGLFVLEREAADLRQSSEVVIRMHHFNADGSRAELCGNGTRCAARLAFELGWAQRELHLHTDSGLLLATELPGNSIRVTTPASPVPPTRFPLDNDLGAYAQAWFLRVGVPHLVVVLDGSSSPWPSLSDLPIDRLAPALRHHEALDDGANVNFVQRSASETARYALRTWERGVEGETLACGSGAVATATVLHLESGVELPLELEVRGGDVLRIGKCVTDPGDTTSRDSRSQLWQEGPALLVARGELFVD